MSKRCLPWILCIVSMLLCCEESTSVVYHLDVTIVNRYGKDVVILTTNPTYWKFTIPIGERYQMKTTTSSNESIYITSFDNTTLKPITINSKNSVLVVPSLTTVSFVYNVPSGPTEILPTQSPTESSMATQNSTTNAARPNQTDDVKTQRPTDGKKANKDVENGWKGKKIYLIVIIVLAILLIILLVVVVGVVVYQPTTNSKMKTEILHQKPNDQDQEMDRNETRF